MAYTTVSMYLIASRAWYAARRAAAMAGEPFNEPQPVLRRG